MHDFSEEEAFWFFTCIMEEILPIDYLSNMKGILIDQKIFEFMIKEKFPEIHNKFEEV